jgi:alkanesulfonate monooxygenase SsuD/methylene tetrahydromethanopterin reductase-like flavin-dependent oxidoreductase (luciferase family)
MLCEEVRMKYGLNLPNGGIGGDARTLAELAQRAEAAGWDGVFLEDYIVWQSVQDTPTYDPWVALAAMALRTERIRLGTSVTPLPRRRPWKLARETVTLDHLSNGRLILGVGLGDLTDVSFTAFGEASENRQRARMLDEALDVLVGLWSGQPFSYQGEHYQVSEVTLLPTPIQQPHIPIWVGGAWPNPGPVRRAARWDGACLFKRTTDGSWHDMTPDDIRAMKASIESQRAKTAPFDVAITEIAVGGRKRGDDWEKERAWIASVAEAGATWWVEYVTSELGGLDAMRARIEEGPLRIDA